MSLYTKGMICNAIYTELPVYEVHLLCALWLYGPQPKTSGER